MPVLNMGAAAAAVSRISGARNDPFMGCNFLVEIQGLIAAGFQSVSGLNATTDTHVLWEGGKNAAPHILPGTTSYGPLVFTRGVTDFDMMWSWYQNVIAGDFKRRNGTIYLLADSDLPVMYWNFVNAFPSAWEGPVLNAETSMVAATSITLRHEGVSNPILTAASKLADPLVPGS